MPEALSDAATGSAPRRRLRAPARRILIVEAALEEFAVQGYDGASLGRVAEAAGIARTALYDHFPSKVALFAALLEAKQRDLLAHLQEAIESGAPAEDRMRAAVSAFLGFAERDPRAWKLLHPQGEPHDPEAAAEQSRHRAEADRVLAGMLAPDVRRAGLEPEGATAQVIFAAQQAGLRGVVRWWFAHPEVDRETVLDAAMKALWDGVAGIEQGAG